MTIPVIPALIRFAALLSDRDLNLFRFLQHPVQIPDIIIHTLCVVFCLLRNIIYHKRIFLILSMGYDIDIPDFNLTAVHDVILESNILYKLFMNLRRILYFINIESVICPPEDSGSWPSGLSRSHGVYRGVRERYLKLM